MKMTPFLLGGAMLSLFVVSCKKEVGKNSLGTNKTIQADLKLEHDYLAFKDLNAFNETLNKIEKLRENRPEFSAWETSVGFHSLYSYLLKARSELEAVQNETEQKTVIDKYKEDFYFNPIAGTLDPKNGQQTISQLLNEKGMIKVGNAVIRYKDDAALSTPDDYASLLQSDNIDVLAGNKAVNVIRRPLKNNDAGRFDINPYSSSYGQTINSLRVGDIHTYKNRKFICQLYEDWTVFPQYTGPEVTSMPFMWRVYLKFSHQRKGTFGWINNASKTYVANIDYTMNGKRYAVYGNNLNVNGVPHYTTGNPTVATASTSFSSFQPNTIIFPQQQETYWYLVNSFEPSVPWYISGTYGAAGSPTYSYDEMQALRAYWGTTDGSIPMSETGFPNFYIDAIGDGFDDGNRLVINYAFMPPYL